MFLTVVRWNPKAVATWLFLMAEAVEQFWKYLLILCISSFEKLTGSFCSLIFGVQCRWQGFPPFFSLNFEFVYKAIHRGSGIVWKSLEGGSEWGGWGRKDSRRLGPPPIPSSGVGWTEAWKAKAKSIEDTFSVLGFFCQPWLLFQVQVLPWRQITKVHGRCRVESNLVFEKRSLE